MFIFIFHLVGFLDLVASDAWPYGVIPVFCFPAGVVMALHLPHFWGATRVYAVVLPPMAAKQKLNVKTEGQYVWKGNSERDGRHCVRIASSY